MSKQKIQKSLNNLGKALNRLEEALNEPKHNSIIIDATIQRFEFSIELLWKTLKRMLADEGIETKSPKEALRQAFQQKWINNEVAWLQMFNDRNETSHIYDENKAKEIYTHIQANFLEMQNVYHFLQKRFDG